MVAFKKKTSKHITGMNNKEAEQMHPFNFGCCFLTLYRPPNTKPLLPTVAQAWAALGNGLFPCSRPHKQRERDWYQICFVFIFLWLRNNSTMGCSRKMAMIISLKGSLEWTPSQHKRVSVVSPNGLVLTVVMGWLHVDVSKSRIWMWLFQPRPGLSHCRSGYSYFYMNWL